MQFNTREINLLYSAVEIYINMLREDEHWLVVEAYDDLLSKLHTFLDPNVGEKKYGK